MYFIQIDIHNYIYLKYVCFRPQFSKYSNVLRLGSCWCHDLAGLYLHKMQCKANLVSECSPFIIVVTSLCTSQPAKHLKQLLAMVSRKRSVILWFWKSCITLAVFVSRSSKLNLLKMALSQSWLFRCKREFLAVAWHFSNPLIDALLNYVCFECNWPYSVY